MIRKAPALVLFHSVVVLILSLFSVTGRAQSHQLSASAPTNGTMLITGTVVLPPPCEINDDKQSPDVEFGSIRADLIDGSLYAQDIPVTVTCAGTPDGALKLSMQGTAAGTTASVLKTSIPGLGLQMRLNQVELPLNSWIDISPNENLTIVATPIIIPGEALPAQEFTADAVLIAEVQ